MAWAERKDSGRWAGRYLDHRGRKRNAGTFPTKEQAVSAAARREGQGESGEVLDLTIEEYFTSWAYSDSNHGTSRETRMGHLRTLRNHVFPKYGNRRMAALQDSQLCRQILYGLQDDPAVAKSIPGRARNAIGAGVRPLVNRQILSVSPVHGIRLSSYVSPMPSIPTKEEFGRIVDAMETEEAKFLTRFALWTAMRPGEMFALRIHDIVWDSDQATILQRRKTVRGAREGDPVVVEREGSKTGGQRRVTISPYQSAQLREYLARTGLSGSDLLFPKRLIDPTHQERRFDPAISAWDPSADYGSFEAQGRTARHGSTTGYGLGCRCRRVRVVPDRRAALAASCARWAACRHGLQVASVQGVDEGRLFDRRRLLAVRCRPRTAPAFADDVRCRDLLRFRSTWTLSCPEFVMAGLG